MWSSGIGYISSIWICPHLVSVRMSRCNASYGHSVLFFLEKCLKMSEKQQKVMIFAKSPTRACSRSIMTNYADPSDITWLRSMIILKVYKLFRATLKTFRAKWSISKCWFLMIFGDFLTFWSWFQLDLLVKHHANMKFGEFFHFRGNNLWIHHQNTIFYPNKQAGTHFGHFRNLRRGSKLWRHNGSPTEVE